MNKQVIIYNFIMLVIALIIPVGLIKVVLAEDSNSLMMIPFQSNQVCQSNNVLKFSLNQDNSQLLKQLISNLLNKPLFILVNEKLKIIAITDEKNARVLINQDYHVVNVATVNGELQSDFVVLTHKNIVMVNSCSKE
ncbi:hypothetical protein L3V82_07770 [Thiotrichales bacterium 19S3-7]|nr:hypothetical protein [Thiotrichales bacterium 19S3-7]MCF6802056.1 hypothetical protein [Thiotrichales bacterium 19S3-11]